MEFVQLISVLGVIGTLLYMVMRIQAHEQGIEKLGRQLDNLKRELEEMKRKE